MASVLYVLCACAAFGAGAVLAGSVSLWSRGMESGEIRNHPSAIETFAAHQGDSKSGSAEVPPLIVQAEAFARFLNPPKSEETPSMPELAVASAPARLSIRPPAPSVGFRLCGTSCCPNQPGRSMALISQAGASEGSERWVKEGSQMGHFVIHEIRQDGIVYRDGDQLREMAVETAGSRKSIVQDIRPGSRRVSAALEDMGTVLPIPAGPNNVAISGN